MTAAAWHRPSRTEALATRRRSASTRSHPGSRSARPRQERSVERRHRHRGRTRPLPLPLPSSLRRATRTVRRTPLLGSRSRRTRRRNWSGAHRTAQRRARSGRTSRLRCRPPRRRIETARRLRCPVVSSTRHCCTYWTRRRLFDCTRHRASHPRTRGRYSAHAMVMTSPAPPHIGAHLHPHTRGTHRSHQCCPVRSARRSTRSLLRSSGRAPRLGRSAAARSSSRRPI